MVEKIEFNFEDNAIDSIDVALGKISLSTDRWADGSQSLRWDFVPGDSLTIRTPIGYVPEPENQDGLIFRQDPRGFDFLVYADRAFDGDMEIAFGREGVIDCWTDVRLIRSGWERFRMLFDRGHLRGQAHPEMDFCRLTILSDTSGTMYLDGFTFSEPGRASHNYPARPALPSVRFHPTRRFLSGTEYSSLHLNRPWFPLADAVSEAEAESIRTIEARYLELEAGGRRSFDRLGDDRLAEIEKKFTTLGIERKDGRVNGPVKVNSQPFASLIKEIGVLYRRTKDASEQDRLADWGVQIAEHAIQANFQIDWYNGRGMPDGMYLLRDRLAELGLLERSAAYLREAYGVNRIYRIHERDGYRNIAGEDSDYLYTNSIGSLLSILIMPDSPEKVRDLRHYADWYGEVATNYAPGLLESLKPDGSHFHHMAPALEGYGNYTMSIVTKMFRIFAGTEFRFSEAAHARVKRNLEIRGFYKTGRYLPMTFAQLIYPARSTTNAVEYLHLAYAGTPDGKEPIDPDMASYFLRYVEGEELRPDTEAGIRDLQSLGFEAIDRPQGHHTLSYAASTIHRRSDWMAVVGGHSRYVRKMELWPHTGDPDALGGRVGTAFTQFVNTGTLEIIYPDRPGREMANNGYAEPGWDWTHFPGTTAINAPLDRIRNRPTWVGDDRAEHPFGDQRFVGGVHSLDGQGMFTGTFRGFEKYGLESMYATKSWFFFDDLIICVGSGIRNDLPQFKTHTTLFQNQVHGGEDTVFAFDGTPVTEDGYQTHRVLETPAFLVDNRGVGYYLAAGQQVDLTLKTQQSRNANDRHDTQGLFTKAWLSHGSAPDGVRYEYAVKVKTDAKAMEQFTDAMHGEMPPYRVIQADQRAHVVEHHETGYLAIALFEKNMELNLGPVRGISMPSLVMLRPEPNGPGLELAVADPDLRFYEGHASNVRHDMSRAEHEPYGAWWSAHDSIPSTFFIVLEGTWQLAKAETPHFEIVQQANGRTILRVHAQHGLSRHARLIPAGS
ncbi:MAG: chondroitinase family polysaccharide lyase [Planctomycetota bacterium]